MSSNGNRSVMVAALALLALGLGTYVYGNRTPAIPQHQGWVEAYFIFVSPDESGRVETLSVAEGDRVETAAPLFALDSELQKAAVAEAEAALVNARISHERAKELLKKSVGSQKTFDDSEAALRTADARLNSARIRLERRRVASPVAGTVQEIYFRAGEMVSSGRPIVSILPPGNTRVRFFVPQAMIPRLAIGQRVHVRCDGCAGDLFASVSFISAQAEFTPPIIYSQEERARLVFRIEARPERPESLRAGQPVTIHLELEHAKGAGHDKR